MTARRRPDLRAPFAIPGAEHASAETIVLLLLVSGGPQAARAPEAMDVIDRTPDFDWERVQALAIRAWVHPLLAYVLMCRPECAPLVHGIPARRRDELALARLAARVRWASYERAVVPFLADLRARGIHPLALKGAALTRTHYPPDTRLLNDLDLWVPPAHFDATAAAMLRHGFTRHAVDGDSAPVNRARYTGWVFTRPRGAAGDRLVIDLHYRLGPSHSPYRLDAHAMAASATTIDFGGEPLRVPTSEHLLVHLGVQLGHDGRFPLHRLADMRTIIGGPSPDAPAMRGSAALQWSLVEHVAADAGASGAVAAALRWCEATGAVVPGETMARLRGAARGADLAEAVLFDLRAMMPGSQLPAAVAMSATAWLATPSRRAAMLAWIPAEIWRRQRAGRASLLRAAFLALRSVAVIVLARALMSWLGRRRRVDDTRTDEIRDRLWAWSTRET